MENKTERLAEALDHKDVGRQLVALSLMDRWMKIDGNV